MSTSNTAWDRRYNVLFDAKVSQLYHRSRERFFDLLDKITKALTVLAGASLLSDEIKNILPLAAACISSLTLLSLVFTYGDKKQKHKELAEGYSLLQGEIESNIYPSDENCNQWLAKYNTLESKEPPTLGALVVICQNQIALAENHPDSIHKLGFFKRSLANWIDFRIA